MRDHNIAYGSNSGGFAPIGTSSVSEQVRRFLDKHADLLHAEADVSWLLDSSADGGLAQATRFMKEAKAPMTRTLRKDVIAD